MNTKPNLFIVFSPLQIINAIEAIHHFNCKNNILVINYKPCQDKNNDQMDDLAGYHKWDEVIKVGSGGRRSKFLIYVSLIKKLKKVQYDHVFVAGFTSAIYTILANLKKNKLFFMDDGVGTITAYNEIFLPNKPVKLKLKHIRFWLFGIRTKFNDRVNLFTYFNLKSLPHVSVIHNDLRWFRSKYTLNSISDKKVYFLGQPHDEHSDPYSKYVSILDNYFNSQEGDIIYVPHRYEDIKKPLRVLFNKYEVKIQEFGMPIEIYFLTNNISPYVVTGFISTALVTISLLYPNTMLKAIYSMSPAEEKLGYKELYRHLYEANIIRLDF